MQTIQQNTQLKVSPFARLQRLAQPRRRQERCELCGVNIPAEHQHLLELNTRQLACACEACAILFSSEESIRYRRVPRRILAIEDFQLSEATWESLHIPINLAFFHRNQSAGKVLAMYPSPAGATESLLSMDAWGDLAAANPVLETMQSDVEALLINRVGRRHDSLLVPIDECYKLVGLIRSQWRGLSGGKEVWSAIETFFEDLNRRAVRGRCVHA